jgi:hypothetical protein
VARLGWQMLLPQKLLVKTAPPFAIRSMFGVPLNSGLYAPIVRKAWSSLNMNRMFGLTGFWLSAADAAKDIPKAPHPEIYPHNFLMFFAIFTPLLLTRF